MHAILYSLRLLLLLLISAAEARGYPRAKSPGYRRRRFRPSLMHGISLNFAAGTYIGMSLEDCLRAIAMAISGHRLCPCPRTLSSAFCHDAFNSAGAKYR